MGSLPWVGFGDDRREKSRVAPMLDPGAARLTADLGFAGVVARERVRRAMPRPLTEEEKTGIEQRVAAAESRTGAEIVVAVVERCDAYPEIPWRAFALAASLAGLLSWAMGLAVPWGTSAPAVWLGVALVLGGGVAAALLAVWIPPFARLFLDRHRAEGEVRQHAESLFLSRELFATQGRRAILLMVGLFERHVVLLPDTGAAGRLPAEAASAVIERMRPLLRARQTAAAVAAGLDALADRLGPRPEDPGGANELSDRVVEEGGAP